MFRPCACLGPNNNALGFRTLMWIMCTPAWVYVVIGCAYDIGRQLCHVMLFKVAWGSYPVQEHNDLANLLSV